MATEELGDDGGADVWPLHRGIKVRGSELESINLSDSSIILTNGDISSVRDAIEEMHQQLI